MPHRKIEDTLRDEYFLLLPEMQSLARLLEVEIEYCLRHLVRLLKPHEHIIVTSRIKECESAIGALRRRQHQEGQLDVFDPTQNYTLKTLKDLVGIRVSVFPRNPLMMKVEDALLEQFPEWTYDPIRLINGKEGEEKLLAFKYYGYSDVNQDIRAEYQIVPLLTHLFWQVEHQAIYKPSIHLKGIEHNSAMQPCIEQVIHALENFENTFEHIEKEASTLLS